MKPILLLIAIFILHLKVLFAQSNCSNPVHVNICPASYLANQTNAGMLDDAPATCNTNGEDLVYEIYAPNGADKIFVSVVGATTSLHLNLETGSCNNGSCISQTAPAGNSNLSFNVISASYYYLWIDAPVSAYFDISIGGDTGQVWVSIPNTKGNLQFDSSGCGTPPFNNLKKFYQVSYNSIYQVAPMTLAPLYIPGNMCITVYFKNTTGNEGIKKFVFDFNSAGYSVINAPASLPGFYNAGNWMLTNGGNIKTYTFVDSAGIGRGDFTGVPDSCIRYEFCFTLTPVSNSPLLTNVKVTMFSDGYGSGYTGYLISGCCPIPKPNCTGGSGPISAGQAFGFGFDDPGAPLPMELLSFNATISGKTVNLNWVTGSEKNVFSFIVERSTDAYIWNEINSIRGSGNSTQKQYYETVDLTPLTGLSYYRLKEINFDGTAFYSRPVSIKNQETTSIIAFPNPVSGMLKITHPGNTKYEFEIYTVFGEKIFLEIQPGGMETSINFQDQTPGIYFLVILQDNQVIKREKILVQK